MDTYYESTQCELKERRNGGEDCVGACTHEKQEWFGALVNTQLSLPVVWNEKVNLTCVFSKLLISSYQCFEVLGFIIQSFAIYVLASISNWPLCIYEY